MQKSFFWFPAKLFLANFRFKRLSLPLYILIHSNKIIEIRGGKRAKTKTGLQHLVTIPVPRLIMNKKPLFLNFDVLNTQYFRIGVFAYGVNLSVLYFAGFPKEPQKAFILNRGGYQ